MTPRIKNIFNLCKDLNIEVSEDFVQFIASLVALGIFSRVKTHDLKKNDAIHKKTMDVLKQRLLDKPAPSIITLKSQFLFIKNYNEREMVVQKHRSRVKYKTAPLIQEICFTVTLNTNRDIEVLYQKMLVVITLVSGLGNPTVPSVLREVAIALQSVLQPSELPRYVTLSMQKKEEQLMELVLIVTGIRLFNRDCDRGGEGIDDLPTILQAALDTSHNSIIEFLEALMEKIYLFTAAVESNIKLSSVNILVSNSDANFPENITWAIEMLVVLRQQEIYVRKLLSDVELCEEEIKILISRLQKGLTDLHEAVKFRTAIPTSQVYPRFIEIATIWMKLQDQVFTLSHVIDLISELRKLFPEDHDEKNHESIRNLLNHVNVLTDAERLELTMGKSIVECEGCEIFYPTNETNFDNLNIQFLGFCAYCFVIGSGALIPGNPNIGIAEWGRKYFAFCCAQHAKEFGQSPLEYLKRAYDLIRRRIEYIHLFQLQDNLQSIVRRDKLTNEDLTLYTNQSQEIQTDLHVFDEWIDVEYSSSLWEHRRRALQLATLARCATRSTQTYNSHFRNGICLQTLEGKDKEVQTNSNVMTNTPKLRKFILRLKKNECDIIQCHDCSFEQFK